MATAATTGPSTGTLRNVNDNQKRWMVFGLALKVLVDQIRSFVAQEIQMQYGNLKTSHGIDTQSTSGRLKNWPTVLKYENINGNDAVPKVKGKHNYSAFDCRVTSHVDFAKLYLENHMAKFTAFDEHCDASVVLNLLGKVPVFSVVVQSAAVNVRQARNSWAHCTFSDWNPVKFHQCFVEMEQLVKSLGLLPADENNLLTDLKEWESKGTLLCMNSTMDPDLLQLVQQDVNALKADVDKLVFEVESDREAVKKALPDVAPDLNELEKRVSSIEAYIENGKKLLALPSRDLESLLSQPCNSKEIVLQLKDCLQLDQATLAQPDPGTQRLIRCLARKVKQSNRLDVFKHLREIAPAGTTGPLLPECRDIRQIPFDQMRELTVTLSGGDEWKVLAAELGLKQHEIRYLDSPRIRNPCDALLAHIANQGNISVGYLYNKLIKCKLPLVADLL